MERSISDEELLAEWRAATGERQRECLEELFGRYHVRVGRWCFRICGDREKAVDLAQEVLMRAFRNLESFAGGSKFSTWMYVVTRNTALNWLRSQPRETSPEDVPDPADPGSDPYEMAEREDEYRRMRELLARVLDETERRAFVLHYGDGVPLAAVTRMLGLENTSGAKAYIVSARRKLARALERLKSGGVSELRKA